MNMKKITGLLFLSALTFGLLGAASLSQSKPAEQVSADSTSTYPRTGSSGTVMFVNGSGNFKKGEADLAIYCFNSTSDNAWSDRSDYRVSGDTIRIVIPGQGKTWSKYIICRYNPNKTPAIDEWGGVYNQSDDLLFSDFLYDQNTITVTGISNNKLTINPVKGATTYYGIKATDNHMYLDLSGFQGWEDGNAKFALYFGCPSSGNGSGWSQAYWQPEDFYYSSFCWKVLGQGNDHLYECIIPSNNGVLWNLVIAVRFNPNVETPYWPDNSEGIIWNRTGNLTFDSTNHTANMIHINDWNGGYIDADNIISRDSRLNFYGQYFLDTVSCSGTGESDATTEEQWNKVKYEYQVHTSKTYEGEIWKMVADKDGSVIAQALARYDYIVLHKHYDHPDFINRAESPNATTYSSSAYMFDSSIDDQNSMIWIIVAILGVTSLATVSLLILKKKKR